MIILNKITDTIQLKLSGAITTNQIDIVVSYDDMFPHGKDESRQVSVSNDTTYVSICDAPGPSITRNIDYVCVYNKDTVNVEVEICYDDNGTKYCMLKQILASGETLQYNASSGWAIF